MSRTAAVTTDTRGAGDCFHFSLRVRCTKGTVYAQPTDNGCTHTHIYILGQKSISFPEERPFNGT